MLPPATTTEKSIGSFGGGFAIRRMQCCPEMLHYEQVTCSRTREDVTVKLGCYCEAGMLL